MTDAAEDEGFAAVCRHDHHPGGMFLLATRVEIREFAHVVDLNVLGCAAEFTAVGKEPTNQLIAFRRACDHDRFVDQDGHP